LYSSAANRANFGQYRSILRRDRQVWKFNIGVRTRRINVGLPPARRFMEEAMRLASGGIRTTVAACAALAFALPSSGLLQGAQPQARDSGTPSVSGPSFGSSTDDRPLNAPATVRSTTNSTSPKAAAQEMQWIWSPAYVDNLSQKSPAGICYFRRTFEMAQPEAGEVQIAADESYELYVNGRKVGEGKDWHVMEVHDITHYLVAGRNTVAVMAAKNELGPAGVAARVLVKSSGDTYVSYVTNTSWKTAQKEFVGWTQSRFNEVQWLSAREIGRFGIVKPWLDESQLAGGSTNGRFKIAPEFRVEPVASAQDMGSLIAMAFNEFGDLLAARENGPLLLLHNPATADGTSRVSVYCDRVKNIQGILPLNGQVLVVGSGPSGVGLYRITETDDAAKAGSDADTASKDAASKDAASKVIDDKGSKRKKPARKSGEKKVDLVLKFTGEMSEHGPHAPILGPDGLIYIMLGDHTKPDKADDPGSPYHHAYEGDLISPRYEDPNGYGVGVQAPGGRILRTDAAGTFIETFAAGFRNPYDIVFNRAGELLTHDSDMEWDVGMPWYRPTRVLHVVAGGEYGWRSGWGAWPSYFFDSLPAIGETGRGSPTAIVAYNHVMFPRRFHDSLFVGDWARGRILNIKLKPSGASYVADTSVFLEGKPLNVTYLAVGPEGGLYFCTGGRDTEGGVYRIVWKGKVPDAIKKIGDGLEAAIRQPQIDSAWARQRVALVKQQVGASWDKELAEAAENPEHKPESRCRALDLMQLLGPFPTPALLVRLSRDPDDHVRAKAAYLMGIHADEATGARLIELLRDANPPVQRIACESLTRAGQKPTWSELKSVLASPDRYVAYAATRLLQQCPKEGWQADALAAKNTRLFLQGALALLVMDPDRATVDAIVEHIRKSMAGYLSDPEFLDLLRVTELAVERGKLSGDDVVELRRRVANEFPSKDRAMNRELIRLLAALGERSANARIIEQIKDPDVPAEDKIHIALMARFIPDWTTSQKLELLKFYEKARALPGGHSFTGYVENVSRDFFAGLTESERARVLAQGANWPSSALSVLAKLPEDPGPETLFRLQALDNQLEGQTGEAVRRLRIGIVAVLGRSGDAQASAYLREVFEKEPDRRGYIAMALADHPDGDNWPVLLRALPIVEGAFAQQVLLKLATVDRSPTEPEPIRQVILRGLKLGDQGGKLAVALLEKWADKTLGDPEDALPAKLALWQKWFAQNYPDQPPATLPEDSNNSHWTFNELLSYLDSPDTISAKPERGAAVFAKANCIKCHRFGDRGESVGPDLTSVSRRFQKREILESILFPSQVISDQYASKSVLLKDGRSVWGIAAQQPDGSLVVLQSDATKITVRKEQIDEVRALKKSAMPEGLLNTLTLEEIADLFAYLGQSPDAKITNRRLQPSR
jgi:putative heme-binding domain-containing protein